jgi:hypothetical protein
MIETHTHRSHSFHPVVGLFSDVVLARVNRRGAGQERHDLGWTSVVCQLDKSVFLKGPNFHDAVFQANLEWDIIVTNTSS